MATLKSGLATSTFWDSAVGGTTRLTGYVSGINRNQVTDGVKNFEMGLDIPPAVATQNSNINGSLDLNATYYYQFCYRRTIHGIIGNGSGASAAMTTTDASNDGIKLDIGADSALQTGIDQIEVYRTVGGGTSYFYEGRKAYTGSAITYDSTIADSALGATLQTDNNTPPSRPHIIYFDGRWILWGSHTHSTGTVTMAASTTVTGATSGVTRGHVGARFNIAADGSKYYEIESVNVSAQTWVIDSIYEGATGAGKSYTISRSPMTLNWSKIDTSGNRRLESFPTANYDEAGGGEDRIGEKATGLGKTRSSILPFTNYSTYITKPKGANVFYAMQVLYPGIGCMNYRTIANASETGNCIWLDQNANVRLSNGTIDGIYNISENFISNILDGTHDGIHNDYAIDTSKYADFHAIYYGLRGWYMLFVTLSGSTYPNACLIFDENINPSGDPRGPSPWMLWTGFNAVCSNMEQDSSGNLRPFFADALGFKWQMDSGTNDYGVSTTGLTTTGTITAADATSFTDSTATFYTTGSGLKGVWARTYDATTLALENDIVIQSNTATKPTVTAWTVTPTVGDTYVIGGIDRQRYTKAYHDEQPYKIKTAHNLYLDVKKASSTRNLTIHHFVDKSSTARVTAGRNIDVSTKRNHKINVRARGNYHQYKISNFYADQAIELYGHTREVDLGSDH